MKQIRFKKEYAHTGRRTWQPGETPHVSNELADRLAAEGVAEIVGETDGLELRGITQDELDEAIREEEQRKEAAQKAEPKTKGKIILPPFKKGSKE